MRRFSLYFSSLGSAGEWVLMFWRVLVADVDAALLVLAELAEIVQRSFLVFLYCVVVAMVIRSRKTLSLVAAEARDSK